MKGVCFIKEWTIPNIVEMDVKLTGSDWLREWGSDALTDDMIGSNNYVTYYRTLTEEEAIS